MNPLLATALLLGVAGSAHCIGMCGPIALAVPSPYPTWRSRLGSTLLLNAGRLVTYALIGAAFGAFGSGLRLAGLQQGLSIAAGVVLLLFVLLPGITTRWSPQGRIALLIGRLRGMLARNLRRTAPEALFLSGALNGLLPCGLVYSAALGAAAMGSVPQSMLFMVLFGIGTWPALVVLRMGASSFGAGMRSSLRRASPVLVSTMAVLLILRGLQLGIPMVSPPAATLPTAVTACH